MGLGLLLALLPFSFPMLGPKNSLQGLHRQLSLGGFDNILSKKMFIIVFSCISNDMLELPCLFRMFTLLLDAAHYIMFHRRYHVTKFYSIYITFWYHICLFSHILQLAGLKFEGI